MEEKRLPIFSKRLIELRGNATQEDFAKKVGLSRPSIGFYENGTRVPDAVGLKKIAEACDTSADWLLGLSDTRAIEIDSRVVTEYTGLSQQAIDYLHRLKDRKKDNDLYTISVLLSSSFCPKFLSRVREIRDMQYKYFTVKPKPINISKVCRGDYFTDPKFAQAQATLNNAGFDPSIYHLADAEEMYTLKKVQLTELFNSAMDELLYTVHSKLSHFKTGDFAHKYRVRNRTSR